jgi:hypothetical protein
MDDRPHLLPPPFDVFYPDKPRRQRTLVSATRVFSALRRRLGCVPTGERGSGGEYWLTPKGVRFPVRDPAVHHERAVVAGGSQRPLFYPYDYAYALIAHASWLVAHAVPEEALRRTSAADLLLDGPPRPHRQPPPEPAETIFV